jgi:PTH1 family peptidyl-tRNA hydrolase
MSCNVVAAQTKRSSSQNRLELIECLLELFQTFFFQALGEEKRAGMKDAQLFRNNSILGTLMKKTYIFGLGNPGIKYQSTRHNAGFMCLDSLQQQLELPEFSFHKKLKAEVAKNSELILAKPMTYMNESGQAVRSTLEYFQEEFQVPQELKNVYVVHDDLDLELGRFKLQFGVGPKQHNGLLSIYQYLKTSQMWHIRVGVDDRQGDRSMPPDKYVLQKLPLNQKKKLALVYKDISQELQSLLANNNHDV